MSQRPEQRQSQNMNQRPEQHQSQSMSQRVFTIISIAAVLLMCAFIFWMSAKPSVDSDAISLSVVGRFISFIVPGYDHMSPTDQLYWQNVLNHPVRKTAHFLEYAALGALMQNMFRQIQKEKSRVTGEAPWSSQRQIAAGAWVLATCYACTDELHQMFIPGRSGQLSDVLLDSCGVLFGVLAFSAVLLLVRRRRKRS